MCKAFSCIVTKKGDVFWKAGIDSHDEIISLNKIKDDTTDGDLIKFAKIEITPDKGYLYPEDKWTLKIDENTTPRWLTKSKQDLCWVAFGKWKEQIYSGINLAEAINPINPLKLQPNEVTEADKELLKKWASVRASVGDSVWASVRASVGVSVRDSVGASVWASVGASVWDSVGASVWDSVWDSVWAYVGSFFKLPRSAWKYTEKIPGNEYPFRSVVYLWKDGLVPSFDGKKWRLHGGNNAKVLWEGTI